MEAFWKYIREKSAIITCILNLEYALLTFLLLPVYHLFIFYCIFKDSIGRNDVWNLGYGGNLDLFGFGGGANHLAGGEGLKGLRVLCGITFVDITITKWVYEATT